MVIRKIEGIDVWRGNLMELDLFVFEDPTELPIVIVLHGFGHVAIQILDSVGGIGMC